MYPIIRYILPPCKHCDSDKVVKNGKRAMSNGVVKQRLVCKDCGCGDIVIITPVGTGGSGSHNQQLPHQCGG